MDDRIKIIQRNFISAWRCASLRQMISTFIGLLHKFVDLKQLEQLLSINKTEIDCSSKQELLKQNLKGLFIWLRFEFDPTFAKPKGPSDVSYNGKKLNFFHMNPVSCTHKLPQFYEFRVLNLTLNSLQELRNFAKGTLILMDDPEPHVCRVYVQYKTYSNQSKEELDDVVEQFKRKIAKENMVIVSDPKLHNQIEYYCWGSVTRNSLKRSTKDNPNSLLIHQICFDFDEYNSNTDFCLHPHTVQIIIFSLIFATFYEKLDYTYTHIKPDIITMPLSLSESFSRESLSKSKPELALLHDFRLSDIGPLATYTDDIDFEKKIVMERLQNFEAQIINKNRYISVILENIIVYMNFAKYIREINTLVVESVGHLNTATLRQNKSKTKEYKGFMRIILHKKDFSIKKTNTISSWKGAGNVLTQWIQMKTFLERYFESEHIHNSFHTTLISPLGDQVYHALIDGSEECPQKVLDDLKEMCDQQKFPMKYYSSGIHQNILIYTNKVETDFMDKFSTLIKNKLNRNINVFTHVGCNVFLSCIMTKSEAECVVDAICIDMYSLQTQWITKIPLLHFLCNVIYDNILPYFIRSKNTNTILFNENTIELFEDINMLKELKNNKQYVFQILESKEQFMQRYEKLYKEEHSIDDVLQKLSLEDESEKKKGKGKKIKLKNTFETEKEASKKTEVSEQVEEIKVSEKTDGKDKVEDKVEERADKNTQTISEWKDEYISKGFSIGYEACSKELIKNKTNASTSTDKVLMMEQKTQVIPNVSAESTQTNSTLFTQKTTQTENFIEEYNRKARERNELQINPYLPLLSLRMGEKGVETGNFPLEIQGSTYFFQNISKNSLLWNILQTNPDNIRWLYMHADEYLLKSLSKPIREEPRNSDEILKIFLNKKNSF